MNLDTLLKEAEAIDLEALLDSEDMKAIIREAESIDLEALLAEAGKIDLDDMWETFFEGKACNAADMGSNLPEGRRPKGV